MAAGLLASGWMGHPRPLWALAAVALAACGGKDPAPAPAPVPTTLSVNPSEVVISARGTLRLSATLLDQVGNLLEDPILWGSSDSGVVTVSDSGSVLAVREGQAVVWARTGTMLRTVPVTVVDPPSVSVWSRLLPPDSMSALLSPAACVFRITVAVADGAPGDSVTLGPSSIEYMDASNNLATIPVDSTQMLDRFGRLVLRSGDTLTSNPLRIIEGSRSGIVNWVRYKVGAETRSVRVPVACPQSARDTLSAPGLIVPSTLHRHGGKP